MGLDIRLPIGSMFTLIGLMLTGYGLFGNRSGYAAHSLGYNVNLWWGIVLLLFGLVFVWFGRRGTSAMRPAATTPEGRATEALEHATVERETTRPDTH